METLVSSIVFQPNHLQTFQHLQTFTNSYKKKQLSSFQPSGRCVSPGHHSVVLATQNFYG